MSGSIYLVLTSPNKGKFPVFTVVVTGGTRGVFRMVEPHSVLS